MSGYTAFQSLSDMPYAVSDYNVAIDDTTGYVYIAGGCDTVQTCAGPLSGFNCVCSELTNKALKYDIPNDVWSTSSSPSDGFFVYQRDRRRSQGVGRRAVVSKQ